MKFKITIQYKILFILVSLVFLLLIATFLQINNILNDNMGKYSDYRIKTSEDVLGKYFDKIMSVNKNNLKALTEINEIKQSIVTQDYIKIPYYFYLYINEYGFDGIQLFNRRGSTLSIVGNTDANSLVTEYMMNKGFISKDFLGFFVDKDRLFIGVSYKINDNFLFAYTLVDNQLAAEIKSALNMSILFVCNNKISAVSDNDLLTNPNVRTGISERKIEYHEYTAVLYKPINDQKNKPIANAVILISNEMIENIKRDSRLGIVSIYLIAGVLAIVIGVFFSRSLVKPIQKLIGWAEKVKEGDYKYFIKIQSNDEIRDLSNVFGSMVEKIDKYNTSLELLVKERTLQLEQANHELNIKNEKINKDLKTAQKLQRALIPYNYTIEGKLSVAGLYVPMDELGGDLYDYITIDENHYGILMIDVCGHGVSAALITTMAKVSFNRFAKLYNDPKDVVQNVNSEICSILRDSGDYFTGYYCVINLKDKILKYVNAGHRKVYLIRGKGKILEMDFNSYYVGVMPDYEFNSDGISLENGDKIIIYTDGIVEARNESDEMFGDKRLSAIIKDCDGKSCQEIVDFLNSELTGFIQSKPMDDDFAVVAIEVFLN